MNVWGHNERSWRKARKRAVSPIIATILLVAITVVLAAVLYVLISTLTHGPGATPIGSAFAAGNPRSGTCAGGGTLATTGCKAGDFYETLTIEQSSVTFGNVLFEVILTSTGGAWGACAGACGFAVLSSAGATVAYENIAATTAMVMLSSPGFTYVGSTTSGSLLNSGVFTISLDLGTGATTGLGISFVCIGQSGYSGTTSAVSLI
jgi:flagellin-like protein